jgi:hypothetical protein
VPVVSRSATSLGSATPALTSTPTIQSPVPAQPAAPDSGFVSAAAGLTGRSDLSLVLAFLDRYFSAINRHDYSAYQRLLGPQMRAQIPRSRFDAQVATTADSDAVLTGIRHTQSQLIAASITFTSHQDLADSATDSRCTDWTITLYLQSAGSSFLMEVPPPSYSALSAAC